MKTTQFVFLVLTFAILSHSCNHEVKHKVDLKGQTMGTYYAIKAYKMTEDGKMSQASIDSMLVAFNKIMSTYDTGSTISRFNRTYQAGPFPVEKMFYDLVIEAKKIHQATRGAFDPTVMPLVNYWNFGYLNKSNQRMDSSAVDSLRQLTGMQLVQPKQIGDEYVVYKIKPHVQLDFSAIAKGFGVDLVADFLEQHGYENYMVEIGGEVSAKGVNFTDKVWTIGIEKPVEEERSLYATVQLKDRAMATSGNYRNFKIINGKKVVHTINPSSGYPEISNLLSASIFAENCLTADAMATAFMVLGLEEALEVGEEFGIDYYMIVSVEDNFTSVSSEGMSGIITE